MQLADRAFAALAAQLGEPTGTAGRIVGRILNRGNRAVVAAAVDAIRGAGPVVADIGFGGGVGLELLLADSGLVHGVEVSATMLAAAHKRYARDVANGRLHLHNARMENLPFDDASINGIVSTNTIYFVDDVSAVFEEFRRVLAPAGRLALGVGDPAAMARMPFTRHGFRLRPIDEITEALRAAGFSEIDDRRAGGGPQQFHVLVGAHHRP